MNRTAHLADTNHIRLSPARSQGCQVNIDRQTVPGDASDWNTIGERHIATDRHAVMEQSVAFISQVGVSMCMYGVHIHNNNNILIYKAQLH